MEPDLCLESASTLGLECLGTRGVERGAGTRTAKPEPRSLALIACGASALDNRRRLVSNKLPGAVLAGPDREVAIVDVHDRANDRDLGRHPSGHQRGTANDQDAIHQMRDLEVRKVTGANLVQIAPLVVEVGL